MKNVIFPRCPICFQNIISDSNMPNYCRLCGMGIEEKDQKFCCKNCNDKLKKIKRKYDGIHN